MKVRISPIEVIATGLSRGSADLLPTALSALSVGEGPDTFHPLQER
jgi:hypothetical protein